MIVPFSAFYSPRVALGKKDDATVYLSERTDALLALLKEEDSLPVDVLRWKTPLPKHCEEIKRPGHGALRPDPKRLSMPAIWAPETSLTKNQTNGAYKYSPLNEIVFSCNLWFQSPCRILF